MHPFRRHLSTVLGLALLFAVTSPAAAQSSVASDTAAKFLGTWTLQFEGGPQGAFGMTLALRADAGKVAGDITTDMNPTPQAITDFAKPAEDLVATFTVDAQGNSFPLKLTLTPDGDDKVKVLLEVGDGQFSLSGTGTKKK